MRFFLGLVAVLTVAASVHAADPSWAAPMRTVHANFDGAAGTIARFGDSITVSLAFFKQLQSTTDTGDATDAVNWLRGYINTNPPGVNSCWNWANDNQPADLTTTGNTGHDWEYKGAKGSQTSAWPLAADQGSPNNVGVWLNKLNPEMAVIMFGSNDASSLSKAAYKSNMRTIAQACINNGTIPLLTTPPPRRGYVTQTGDYAAAIRELGTELGVPVIDYNADILARRPTDWDGSLISSDGVHPSFPSNTNNFSASSLNSSGYTLRNYDTVKGLYDVYEYVIVPEPGSMALLALGAAALLRRRR